MTETRATNPNHTLFGVPVGQRRLDLDVLRCVAVVSVLLYHFDVSPVSGGFVGVDIFFVISGYLITGLIVDHLSKGQFSLGSFLLRRLRRLVPALLTTAAITYLVGMSLFFAQDFGRLGLSTLSTVFGVSNIFFWMESGYFDIDSFRKPLLHTWSLSVEMQFYLIWPLILIGLSRLFAGRFFWPSLMS